MKILINILILFFMVSCGLESADMEQKVQDNSIVKETYAELGASGLTIRNSTRAALYLLEYYVKSSNSCAVYMDIEKSKIPYYLIFSNNPGKSVAIKDYDGNISQSVKVVWNEYEKIWQTENVYFKPGENNIELSASDIAEKQAPMKSAENPDLPAFTFLSWGGWQSFVESDPSGNFYRIKYNLWMDFSVSNALTIYEMKVKVISGPAAIVGNEYKSVPEASYNGLIKYGIDIVSGAGYKTMSYGSVSFDNSITVRLYINNCLVRDFDFNLVNTVDNNTLIYNTNNSYFSYGIGYNYAGLDDVYRQQVFIRALSGYKDVYRVPLYAMDHKFYDGYYHSLTGTPTVYNYMTNFNNSPMLLFLNGMNTPNLSYTYPYNTGITTNFISTSIVPTDKIVDIMTRWSPPKSQILIAHSHGATRGLAYIKSMGVNADRIKGFISIDGLLKGNEVMRGGIAKTGPEVFNIFDILIKGSDAMLTAGFGLIGSEILNMILDNRELIARKLGLTSNELICDILSLSRGLLPSFFTPEMLNQVNPESSFIQNYLGAGSTGSNFSPILPSHVYVGQIIGLNNDPMYFAGSPGESNYDNAKIAITAIGIGLGVAEGFNIVAGISYTSIGLLPLGIWHFYHAYNAGAALDWVNNYSNYYGDLLGSRENDCLVPKYSQMRGINELGGRPIDVVDWQFTITNMIHNCNLKLANNVHPEVWGTNGGLVSRTINPGGKIYDWFVLRGWKVDSSKMNY